MASPLFIVIGIAALIYQAEGKAKCKFGKLPRPQNAELEDFSAKRGVAVFICKAGYGMASNGQTTQTIKCDPKMSNGWQKAESCVKVVKKSCRTPRRWAKRFPQSHLKGEYPIGKMNPITCPKRYLLKGVSGQLKCNKDGRWSKTSRHMRCRRNTCKVPESWKQTVEETLKDEIWVGQKITVTCPGPGQMDPSIKARRGVIKCLGGGRWDTQSKTPCSSKGKKCLVPDSWVKYFSGVFQRKEYLPGATVIFSMTWPKFLRKARALAWADDVITCMANGKWNVENLYVTAKGCHVPKGWRPLFQGRNRVPVGTTYQLKCRPYMEFTPRLKVTNGKLECMPNGRWNIRPPRALCKPIQRKRMCKFPVEWRLLSPSLANYVGVYAGRSVPVAACQKGFHKHPKLVAAKSIITCRKDLKWKISPKTMLCTSRMLEKAKFNCPLPRRWRKVMARPFKAANELHGWLKLGFSCGPGMVTTKQLAATGGFLTCNGSTGTWMGLDMSKPLCETAFR